MLNVPYQQRRATIILVSCAAVMTLGGCAKPGQYDLSLRPSASVPRGARIEVAPVTVGITNDSLDLTAPVLVRSAIVNAIAETEQFENVAYEIAAEEGVYIYRVSCHIDEFESGSRGGRWLLGGLGTGQAHLDATCRFYDIQRDALYAEGVFTGKVRGGFFGGGASIEGMSDDLAAAVARFLERGR